MNWIDRLVIALVYALMVVMVPVVIFAIWQAIA